MKTRLLKNILFFGLAISLSASAYAANGMKGDIEVGPYVGGSFPGTFGTTEIGDAPLVGGRFGYFFTDHFSLEASLQRAFSDFAGTTSVDMDSYRLNGLWNFLPGETIRPFLTVGPAIENVDMPGPGSSSNLGLNAGGGFRWFPKPQIALRADGRYVGSDVDPAAGWENWAEFSLGITWLFNPRKNSRVASASMAAGPKDADGDGVADRKDDCPNTPKGAKVLANGCAVDSDRDKVADHYDRCPGTPEGTRVDKKGCPLTSKARGVLKGVVFETSSATLTSDAKSVLDDVADALRQFPSLNVEVQGHTDSMGDDAMNLSLSQARADSVKQYLAGKGISTERMTAKGYGETKPVASNQTRDGRKQNRRVEVDWLD